MTDKYNMDELNKAINDGAKMLDIIKELINEKTDDTKIDAIEQILNEFSELLNLMNGIDKLDGGKNTDKLNDINQEINTYASILALMRDMDAASNTNTDKDKDKETNTMTDKINHPDHYIKGGSIECIDEMVEVFGVRATMDFCLCNVWKYRRRALYKNGEEDMAKADFYMNKFIELKSKNIYNK